jgi:lipopolysaccharide export system protein LptC
MHDQTLANPAFRAGLYQRLGRRNRLVGLLRFLVPLAGVLIFAFLVVQIVIANMARDYGVSGIHLDRNRLVIDTPRYQGVTEAGLRYSVVAETASAEVSNANIIELGTATLEVTRPDGVSFTARAKSARYDLIGGTVVVPGVAEVVDSRKTHAILHNAHADWGAQIITARDGADITFADGTRLLAKSLVMYGADNRWDMQGVILETPGSETTQ